MQSVKKKSRPAFMAIFSFAILIWWYCDNDNFTIYCVVLSYSAECPDGITVPTNLWNCKIQIRQMKLYHVLQQKCDVTILLYTKILIMSYHRLWFFYIAVYIAIGLLSSRIRKCLEGLLTEEPDTSEQKHHLKPETYKIRRAHFFKNSLNWFENAWLFHV